MGQRLWAQSTDSLVTPSAPVLTWPWRPSSGVAPTVPCCPRTCRREDSLRVESRPLPALAGDAVRRRSRVCRLPPGRFVQHDFFRLSLRSEA